ncbi:MAG: hypothetical protein HUJ95_00260, partial [Bacteroidales bacterium]|nr:hypothetical protein [Bacteroidales bacterium]
AVILTFSCKKNEPKEDPYNGHEYVNLGLSVNWATCNIGASSAADYGSYFAWGEAEAKENYSWGTYKLGNYNESATPDYGLTKYYSGDGLKTLVAADDPATVAWKGKWRTPTIDEIKELFDNCSLTWTTQKNSKGEDINGYLLTSKVAGFEGNSIFLPAAGYGENGESKMVNEGGDYWASTLNEHNFAKAYFFYFDDEIYSWSDTEERFYGQSVRAVAK